MPTACFPPLTPFPSLSQHALGIWMAERPGRLQPGSRPSATTIFTNPHSPRPPLLLLLSFLPAVSTCTALSTMWTLRRVHPTLLLRKGMGASTSAMTSTIQSLLLQRPGFRGSAARKSPSTKQVSFFASCSDRFEDPFKRKIEGGPTTGADRGRSAAGEPKDDLKPIDGIKEFSILDFLESDDPSELIASRVDKEREEKSSENFPQTDLTERKGIVALDPPLPRDSSFFCDRNLSHPYTSSRRSRSITCLS